MKLFPISVVGHYSTIGSHSAYIMTTSVYLIKKKEKKGFLFFCFLETSRTAAIAVPTSELLLPLCVFVGGC